MKVHHVGRGQLSAQRRSPRDQSVQLCRIDQIVDDVALGFVMLGHAQHAAGEAEQVQAVLRGRIGYAQP